MGLKNCKTNKFKINLNEKDYEFFARQTGLSREELKRIFDKYCKRNPSGLINKIEFKIIYAELKPHEPFVCLDEIADYVFKYFDPNSTGTVTFNQLLAAFTLISRKKSSPKAIDLMPKYLLCKNQCEKVCNCEFNKELRSDTNNRCLLENRQLCIPGNRQLLFKKIDLDQFLDNTNDTVILRREGPDVRIIVRNNSFNKRCDARMQQCCNKLN